MPRHPLPPTAAVVSFIDCVNRGDIEGLAALMTEDHQLAVLDEAPLVGRDANIEAWIGYVTSFPEYVIRPRHLVADGGRVAMVGTTTGSHLGLPDDEELLLEVVWVAEVVDGRLASWQIVEDGAELRRALGLPPWAPPDRWVTG